MNSEDKTLHLMNETSGGHWGDHAHFLRFAKALNDQAWVEQMRLRHAMNNQILQSYKNGRQDEAVQWELLFGQHIYTDCPNIEHPGRRRPDCPVCQEMEPDWMPSLKE